MIDFKNICFKLRYSHFLRPLFYIIARLGIRITPYCLFMEILSPENPPRRPAGFESYEVSFLGMEEMQVMAQLTDRIFSEEFLVQRLKDGHKCLGLKKDNKLLAFTWCNLKEATLQYNQFSLKKDEAYLFDGYTRRDYRGKGLAPFLRYHLYKKLGKIDRTTFYSYSKCFDLSAVRFKQKLRAKKKKLIVIVELFGKWNFSFLLKSYQQ